MESKIADTPELRAAEAAWRKADQRWSDEIRRDCASKHGILIYRARADRAWSAVLRAMKPIA